MQVTKINNLTLATKQIEVEAKKIDKSYIIHPGAVCIIAIDNDKLILVKQFRETLQDTIVELPAGKIKSGELPIEAAKREMLEETGYICNDLIFVGSYYTTPGFSNQKLTFYFTDNLTKYLKQDVYGEDVDEQITLVLVDVKDFLQNADEIEDLKTIFAKQVINEYYIN